MSKLILTNEVSGLGGAGDVVEVKDGYARNYLIPQGFAVRWTRGAEKQVDQLKAARAAREQATAEEAQQLKASLEAAPVKLAVKAGRDGRLFGAVKPAAIADAVATAGLGQIDKRKLELPTVIKSVGEHVALLKLRDGLVARIAVQVVAAK